MNCSGNHVRICKMKEVNGRLVRPDSGEVFLIRVESCSQRRHYRLNESNSFCVELDHLCNETYCVSEESGEYEVSYEIDGVASEEACINFNRQSFHTITIINHNSTPTRRGSLRLNKRIFNRCNTAMDSRESFVFDVRGNNFTRTITLSNNNNYTALIEDMPFGEYVVSERNPSGYDVVYVVDGVESEHGDIMIRRENESMEIQNHANDGAHVLRICKWIRDNGRLVKPSGEESYDITISDGYALREYTLNCENRFCIMLEGNHNDRFIINEIDADNVVYELDGEIVDEVDVMMNSDHDVRIINSNGTSGNGSIFIRKWLLENGRLVVPASNMSFRLRIQGYSEEVYTLNDNNNFTLSFEDVESGYYIINEEPVEGYEVSFEVNGVPQSDGYFRVEANEESAINMINEQRDSNLDVITIVKRIGVNNSDEVRVPTEGTFEVYLEGPEGGNYFTLNRSNNYQVRYEAMQGWYTMYEVNPPGSVTYRLDGVDHDNELNFYVDGFDHEAMVINHLNNRVNFTF